VVSRVFCLLLKEELVTDAYCFLEYAPLHACKGLRKACFVAQFTFTHSIAF